MSKKKDVKDSGKGLQTRRQFLKVAGIGGLGAASLYLLGCAAEAVTTTVTAPGTTTTVTAAGGTTTVTSPGTTVTAVPAAITWDYDVDVVVAGSGNGGMSAALAAADGGATVLMIEISVVTGGNTLFSGGLMHMVGLETWAEYKEYTEGFHHPTLGKVFVETFRNEYIPWLLAKGAYMERPNPDIVGWGSDWYLGKGEPGQLRHRLYFDSLAEAYEAKGGTTLFKTRAIKLYTDDEERVIGLRAMVWSNSPLEENQRFINIKAKKTILSIGGWHQNKEMKVKYIGRDADTARGYCGPFSSGEGVKMAQAVGASMSTLGLSSVSGISAAITGYLSPSGATQLNWDVDEFLKIFEDYSPEEYTTPYFIGRLTPPGWISLTPHWGGRSAGIWVNKEGKRFIDEASPIANKYARGPTSLMYQPGGFAWLIGDQDIYDSSSASEAAVQRIIDEGGDLGNNGNVIIADSIEEFANLLEGAGMYKGTFLKMIAEYNQACDNGTQEELDPPHYTGNESGGWAIRTPKFYAIPTTQAIYLTYGGLAINEHAQTLDYQERPIPNLYSPPPLGGGIQREIYTGAIASAGTFGYLAGKHAAATI